MLAEDEKDCQAADAIQSSQVTTLAHDQIYAAVSSTVRTLEAGLETHVVEGQGPAIGQAVSGNFTPVLAWQR